MKKITIGFFLLLSTFSSLAHSSISPATRAVLDNFSHEMKREYTGKLPLAPFQSTKEIKKKLDSIMNAASDCGHARYNYFTHGKPFDSMNRSHCDDVEDFKGKFFPRLRVSDKELITDSVRSLLYKFYGYDVMD